MHRREHNSLLLPWHCYHLCVVLFISHCLSLTYAPLFCPLDRWGHRGPEGEPLAQVTQAVSARAWTFNPRRELSPAGTPACRVDPDLTLKPSGLSFSTCSTGMRLAGLSWAVVRTRGYDACDTVDGVIDIEIILIKPHLSALA